MLFYTTATISSLPNARIIANTVKQQFPDASMCLMLCDQLPSHMHLDTESFDYILHSCDFIFSDEISTSYWHFLHTPQALCAAIKPMAALAFTELTGEDKLVYLAPNGGSFDHLKELDTLLENNDILIAPHPKLTELDFNPLQSAYDPSFFAVRCSSPQGKQFLNRWAHSAKTLWNTSSEIDENAYNRLIDVVPALFKSIHILPAAYYTSQPLSIDKSAVDPQSNFPCVYNTYDNGEPISKEHRDAARNDKELFSCYALTDPFSTRNSKCLYHTLRSHESNEDTGLYWNEYQDVLNSTSYRIGKKIVDLAGKLLPTGLFNKLRRKSTMESLTIDPETDASPLELTPLTIPVSSSPIISAVILGCTDFEQTYKTIQSIVKNNPDFDYEILLTESFSSEDKIRLTNTVSRLIFTEAPTLLSAMNKARGRYILLLDEHLTVPDHFFSDVVEYMVCSCSGIVQTKVCFSDHTIFEAGGIMTQSGHRISYGFGLNQNLGCVNYYKEIDCAGLRGTIINSHALNEIGGFDTGFCDIYTIADASFSMRKLHLKTMYNPELQLLDRRTCDVSLQTFAPANEAYSFSIRWRDTLLTENIADRREIFHGRDRSKGKKTIFAVDDRIPCYDLSAGDRNTYQYYETIADMGYNLKIVGNDFTRQEPYATKLERQGIEIVAADGRGEVEYREFLRDYGKFVDTAYLNRPNNLAKYTPEIKKYNPDARIVYCCHDLHFLRELREFEIIGNKKEAERVRNYAKEEIARMDMADVVFDVSAYEKSILDPHLKHARVEVNPIFIYREFPEFKENFTERKDLLFVGSFKHPGNLDGVAWLCKEIMPIVVKAIPEIKLHLVGAHPTPEIKALANNHIVVHGFLSDEALAEMYRSCRLSVVPLRFGAGVKGKVLEAMYYGLPIVSTSIGTEGIVDIEHCIENTDGTKAFANKIIELYPQIHTLTEMGKNNWQYVQDHLGVEPAKALFRRSF